MILLLAGIVSVPILLNPERHRQEITDTLSKLLKRPVVIGPISMSYLPPTLHLEQVAVMKEPGNPLLQIGSTAAPLDWVALLHLQFAPQEIELSHWTLTVLRKPDGSWDITDYLVGTSGLTTVKSGTLRQVRWKEGEIHWSDPHGKVPQDLVLATVEGHWDPRPETLDAQGAFSSIVAGTRVSFNAKGQFFSSPQWTGDIQFSDGGNAATFHVTKNADALDLKAQSAKWRLANALAFLKFYGRGSVSSVDAASSLALDNWQFHASTQKGRTTFEHSATIAGGPNEVKGTIEKGVPSAQVHADIAMRDVPAETVLDITGEKIPLDGKFTTVIKGFETQLSSSALSTVSGEGYFEFTNGQYRLPESSVKRLTKAKTMAYIKSKFPDLDQKGLPVTKLAAHWKAKGGIVSADDGLFVSTDMKAGWVGKVDLAKEGVDGYLRIQIHEKDPKKLRLFPVKYHDQPAYGRLQGTFVEWSLRAVPSSKVPSGTLSKLSRAIRAK
jgi:hypothetical protein